MKLKNSKRSKNGFTMVELLAIVAILGVIIAIVVPVSLSYVRNSRDKAFYLNVQEIVKKVKMENELKRARHCYYNITEAKINGKEEPEQIEIELVEYIKNNISNIKEMAILSYEDLDGKTKYAIQAQEKETGDWINVQDFEEIGQNDKDNWNKDGATYMINGLTGQGVGVGREDPLIQMFQTSKKNAVSNYNDSSKCTLDFKEGN